MSEYKMPIISKQVVIPLNIEDGTISFSDYKKKYGIDIADYFKEDSLNISCEIKIAYMRNDNELAFVAPPNVLETNNEQRTTYFGVYLYNTSNQPNTGIVGIIKWATKEIELSEL